MNDRNSWLRAAMRAQLAQELVLALAVRQVRAAPCSRMRAGIASSISASSDGGADGLQHRVALGRVGADVAGLERFESHRMELSHDRRLT